MQRGQGDGEMRTGMKVPLTEKGKVKGSLTARESRCQCYQNLTYEAGIYGNRSAYRTDSHSYGDGKLPPSAIFVLETWGNQWNEFYF